MPSENTDKTNKKKRDRLTKRGKTVGEKGLTDRDSQISSDGQTERDRLTKRAKEGRACSELMTVLIRRWMFSRSPLGTQLANEKKSQFNEEWINKWINRPINKWINAKRQIMIDARSVLCVYAGFWGLQLHVFIIRLRRGMKQRFMMFDVWSPCVCPTTHTHV